MIFLTTNHMNMGNIVTMQRNKLILRNELCKGKEEFPPEWGMVWNYNIRYTGIKVCITVYDDKMDG